MAAAEWRCGFRCSRNRRATRIHRVRCECSAGNPRCVLRRTEEVGLEFEPELVRDHRYLFTNEKVTTVPSEREQGYETACAVFAAGENRGETRPDGILIVNDLMTLGVMKALENLGLEVGRDIQIATLANAGSPILTDYEDRLIRLEFDAQEVTAELFAMLETLMRGETIAQPSVKVAPHLRDAGN